MVIISSSQILLVYSLCCLPFAIYCIFGGLQIVFRRQKIILLHYRPLFPILRITRGNDFMQARREKFLNTGEYIRQGWYALIAGILMIIAILSAIIDYMSQ